MKTKEVLGLYRELEKKNFAITSKKVEIESSDEYLNISNKIKELGDMQKAMTSHLAADYGGIQKLEEELMIAMVADNISSFDDVLLKKKG